MKMIDQQGTEVINYKKNKSNNLFCVNIDIEIPDGIYIIQICYGNELTAGIVNFIRWFITGLI